VLLSQSLACWLLGLGFCYVFARAVRLHLQELGV
jgi:hypothetical protein